MFGLQDASTSGIIGFYVMVIWKSFTWVQGFDDLKVDDNNISTT